MTLYSTKLYAEVTSRYCPLLAIALSEGSAKYGPLRCLFLYVLYVAKNGVYILKDCTKRKKKERYVAETVWPAKPKISFGSMLMTSDLHVQV